MMRPVFIWIMAEPCANVSAYRLLMTHSSSMCWAMCGKASEHHWPDWPCWRNLRREASSFCFWTEPAAHLDLDRLAVALLQLRLVVEEVHLRRAAVHEQEDAAAWPCAGEVRRPRRQRIGVSVPARVSVAGEEAVAARASDVSARPAKPAPVSQRNSRRVPQQGDPRHGDASWFDHPVTLETGSLLYSIPPGGMSQVSEKLSRA